MAPNDRPTSPRIAALIEVLASDPGTLEQFWQAIAEEGTPLVETLPDDPGYVLITCLWRGDAETRHVVFYSELLRAMWWNGWEDALLTRLDGTDLFYGTYRVRTDMRFVYWISPNHPLHHIRDVEDWEAYWVHCCLDPLNPHVFVQDEDRSYMELPAAPPQLWFQHRQGVPAGRLTEQSWRGSAQDSERSMWIYTPVGYESTNQVYPFVLLFDGDLYTTHIPAPTILDNLIAEGQIPPTVAVLVGHQDRTTELTCNDAFTALIAGELIPWVRANYRVATDPSACVVGGVSLGGLAAAYMGLKRPDLFGNVLSQSGAFYWSEAASAAPQWSYEPPPEDCWLLRQFATTERLPLRFWLEAGLLEDHRDPSITSVLRSTRHLRNVLDARGYEVAYHEYAGGHQYINWRGTLPNALIALLGSRSDH